MMYSCRGRDFGREWLKGTAKRNITHTCIFETFSPFLSIMNFWRSSIFQMPKTSPSNFDWIEFALLTVATCKQLVSFHSQLKVNRYWGYNFISKNNQYQIQFEDSLIYPQAANIISPILSQGFLRILPRHIIWPHHELFTASNWDPQ